MKKKEKEMKCSDLKGKTKCLPETKIFSLLKISFSHIGIHQFLCETVCCKVSPPFGVLL